MKKFMAFCCSVIISTSLIGCSTSDIDTNIITTNITNQVALVNESDELNIVCTIFPMYDWIQEIVGDSANVNIKFLCDSGIDLHNYQPTVQDIILIQESDLFIYVGGDSDYWVDDVIKNSNNGLNLIEVLGDSVVFQEEVEGMQEHDHDHDHSHDYGDSLWGKVRTFFSNLYHVVFPHDHSHDDEYDEHVWLSLRNASVLVDAISTELSTLLPENKADFNSNTTAYIQKLDELDQHYTKMTASANRDTIVVADRFALRYIVEDYDLEYFAAFSGCSSDAEVSFDTLKFLIDKTAELGLDYLMIIEGSDGKLAETISQSSPVEGVVTFNSMQSISQNDVERGVNYLDIMESNLEVLTKALS